MNKIAKIILDCAKGNIPTAYSSMEKEAIKKYNTGGLYSCLNGRTRSSGRHPITNEKLRWVYCD